MNGGYGILERVVCLLKFYCLRCEREGGSEVILGIIVMKKKLKMCNSHIYDILVFLDENL